MTDFDMHDDELLTNVQKALDALGVEKGVVIIANPDNDKLVFHYRGDPCWVVGAGNLAISGLKREIGL